MARWLAGVLWLACVAPAAAVPAQGDRGDVAGRITDATGTALSGVVVTLQDVAAGVVRTATTGEDGRFLLAGLPAGDAYDLEAARGGFAPAGRTGVTVLAGRTVAVEIVLTVAAGSTVTVSARADAISRLDPTLQQTVTEPLLRAVPVFSRNFLEFTLLAAGFTGAPDFPSPQGQIYWAHNVLVDGVSHFSKWRSAPRAFASGYSLESIAEIQVRTNLFSSEYGDALASLTNVVTRAGTSEWHGSALFYAHGDALDGMPAFAPSKPPTASHVAAVSGGGPLPGGRTFVWTSYEGRRSRTRNVVVSPAAAGEMVPDDRDEHLLFVRIDRRRSASEAIVARYSGQLFDWHREPGGLVLPGSGTRYVNEAHTALVTGRFVAGSGLLHEVRVQGSRYVDIRRDLSPSAYVWRAGYSIEGGSFGPGGFGARPEMTWEGADVVSLQAGSHTLRMGGGGRLVRAHTTSYGQGYGAYYFAGSPDVYRAPYLFVQGVAMSDRAARTDPRSLAGHLFAHDDWRVRSRVTVNAGVRYDVERISNVDGFSPRTDWNNVQPRVGATWDPTGSGRTILRGGAGVYTEQQLLYPAARAQLEGAGGVAAVSLAPGSPLMPAFPDTLEIAPGVLLPPRDLYRVAAEFHNPYAIQAVVGVEHLRFGAVLSVDYVRLDGRELMSLLDANPPASNAKPAQRSVAAADATRPLVPADGTFRNIVTLGNAGRSWYRALQVKARRSRGAWQMLASYTLSKADDMGNFQLPEDSRNLSADRGPALADVRHNVTGAFTWVVPGGAGPVWTGWTVSALAAFRTGRPYTITWGDDRNGTAQHDARPDRRNSARTGAYRSVDAAVVKRVPAGRASLEARLEAFNLLGAVNYDQYVGQLLSPLFARPISAFPPRRVQLGAVLRF